MYFWINFFLWGFGILWIGMFFALGLAPRWEKVPRIALAIAYTLCCLPLAYLKITRADTSLSDIFYWMAVVTLLLYISFPFKDKWWKKILLFVLFNITTYISEILCKFIAGYTDLSFDPSFNSLEMTTIVAANTAILLLISGLLLILWNRFLGNKTIVRHTSIFFIFPLSQLITLFALDDRLPVEGTFGGVLGSIGILLGFLADFILLYILMEQAQKESLAKQLQELETLYRVEKIHYQSIEVRREEMAKLRHDFNNQLATAYHLIEQGETKQVRSLLNAIQADIAGTGEYIYCGNAVVNAVLGEKAAVCQVHGIELETELNLGQELLIQSVHLCSIFTNLLDNAINAAQLCPESERFISVKAARKEDYLYIKVENSAVEEKMVNLQKRKGYGQQILRDIALKYSGEFQTDWKEGVYRSILSLTVGQ